MRAASGVALCAKQIRKKRRVTLYLQPTPEREYHTTAAMREEGDSPRRQAVLMLEEPVQAGRRPRSQNQSARPLAS